MSEKRHAISAPALMAAFVALLLAGWAGRAFAASPYDEALAAYSHGGYGKAIKLLGEYVKKTPSAGAYYLLGYSNYKLGRYKEAAEYFSEAYLIDPNFNFSPAGRTCPPAKTGPGGGAVAP